MIADREARRYGGRKHGRAIAFGQSDARHSGESRNPGESLQNTSLAGRGAHRLENYEKFG